MSVEPGERHHLDPLVTSKRLADVGSGASDNIDDARRVCLPPEEFSRNCSADSGVSEAGFSTTVFPQTSAGAIFHEGIAMGKFHGVMRLQTPRG